jgi:hypothetical protein
MPKLYSGKGPSGYRGSERASMGGVRPEGKYSSVHYATAVEIGHLLPRNLEQLQQSIRTGRAIVRASWHRPHGNICKRCGWQSTKGIVGGLCQDQAACSERAADWA